MIPVSPWHIIVSRRSSIQWSVKYGTAVRKSMNWQMNEWVNRVLTMIVRFQGRRKMDKIMDKIPICLTSQDSGCFSKSEFGVAVHILWRREFFSLRLKVRIKWLIIFLEIRKEGLCIRCNEADATFRFLQRMIRRDLEFHHCWWKEQFCLVVWKLWLDLF